MTQKDKKLKINQMMKIQIANFGTIEIGHKTEMGNVAQVIEMGNEERKRKSLRPMTIEEILRKQSFWEFVIARNTLDFKSVNLTDFTNNHSTNIEQSVILNKFVSLNEEANGLVSSNFKELEKYKDLMGQINYSELMKKFPNLIKSKRGRYGGTWAELYILLKIASMLDKDLEVAIYDVFIKSQILTHRDNGGESFKKLNIAIDKYIPSPSGNSQGQFRAIAILLRKKLEITSTKGYNQKEHNAGIQQKRDEIEKFLIGTLQMKLVTSYEQLKTVAENFEIAD